MDPFTEKDKNEIDNRNKKIKTFKVLTRELPDSAFTTYFGKPAFANYGAGDKAKEIARHKSHSVMPHAGTNKPDSVQSHRGALKKANVINHESRVPKNPLQTSPPQDPKVKVSEYYNV